MGSRRLLLVLLFVLAPLTGCAVPLSQSDEQVTQECEDGFWTEAKEQTGYTPTPEGRAKVHRVCAALVAAGIRDGDDEEALEQFIYDHPEHAVALCEAMAPVLYPLIPAAQQRYISGDDVTRLSAAGCRYATAHRQTIGNFDLTPLFKARPELISPFCVAGSMDFYDQLSAADRKSLPRQSFEALSDRVCRKAIREGVLDYSTGDYLNPRIDRARLMAIYATTIARMRASDELPKVAR